MSNPVGLGKGIGIPVKLLHEAEGHTVTVRTLATNPRDVRTPSPLARAPRAVSRIEMRALENLVQAGAVPTRPPIAPLTPSPLPLPPQIELKTGETYRGTLLESEDNWNCQLQGITHTGRDGRVNQLEHAYIRGSKIRFLVIPDMLKNAPMFKRIDPRTGARGAGRSRRGGRRSGGRGAQ